MASRGPRKRLIDQTVDEAMEATCATDHALRHWQTALADGVVTMEEALEGVRLIERALEESRDVVRIAELANQVQRIGLAYIHGDGVIPPAVLADAATVGVEGPQRAA